jgi:hypothetical protein
MNDPCGYYLTTAQRIAHLRFMAEWWAGVHCEWVRNDVKRAAVLAELQAMGVKS